METVQQSVPFHLNVGAELLVEIEALKLRIKCALVGFETGQYIIIRLSSKDLIGNFRSESVRESPIMVRYLYQGAVYGFRAEVLGVVSAPAKIFFLSYPAKIEEYAVREKQRFECVLPASTMFGNDITDMVIIDVSMEGCQCVIKARPGKASIYDTVQINKAIHVRVQFPGKDGVYDLQGKIRNVSKGEDRILLGVMFEGLSAQARERIGEFISLVNSAR